MVQTVFDSKDIEMLVKIAASCDPDRFTDKAQIVIYKCKGIMAEAKISNPGACIHIQP